MAGRRSASLGERVAPADACRASWCEKPLRKKVSETRFNEMGLLGIAAGVALTLFGMRFLRKGLDRLFGGALFRWLSGLSRSRWRAFGGGVVIGTVAPSSTGLAILGAQLLGREKGGLGATTVLAVLLGASVGLTAAVQLVSFHIGDFAGVLIVLGVAGYQFCTREVLRGVGQCLLALGFVFLAMTTIGAGAQTLTADAEVRDVLLRLQSHRWLIFVVVSGLAVLLQSSTATIMLGLALATSGVLAPEAIVLWVVATNVGLGLTSLVMGWSQIESRRLGVSNVIAKLSIALPLLFVPALGRAMFEIMPGEMMRQTAMWHTAFNLLVAVIALPLLGPIHRLAELIVPRPVEAGLTPGESFLDARVLDTPSIALVRATRETLRMADHVRLMLENFWTAFSRGDGELARRVQKEDDAVDRMNVEIKNYLSRIGENRNAGDTTWQFTLLAFSAELEAVGDLVDKHLCDALIKQSRERMGMVEPDRKAMAEAYGRVLRSLDIAIGLLTTREANDARELVREKHEFNEWARELQRKHYEGLAAAGSAEQLASSSFFVDAFNALRRINSHLSTIGYSFLPAADLPAAEMKER